jgi:hypothetical protein
MQAKTLRLNSALNKRAFAIRHKSNYLSKDKLRRVVDSFWTN